MNRTVLTIAGSDPGGGAGIQADLRTLTALGVDGLSTITAITVQNSLGVYGVYPVESDAFAGQLNRLFEDTSPDAIKIGMLGNAKQVEIVVSIFEKRIPNNVVLDPVLASTGGTPLLDSAGRYLLLTTLLPYAAILTPNITEAEQLTGLTVDDSSSMIVAAKALLARGAKAVLVKGGHSKGAPSDWLVQRNKEPVEFTGERIKTAHNHGTGCLLSTAIAAGLANGLPLEKAVGNAKILVTDALRHPVVHGKGRGYPDAIRATRPRPTDTNESHAARLAKFKGLYVITDPALQAGRSHESIVRQALAGGASIIQLRDKTLSIPDLVAQAKLLNEIVQNAGKLFIINDRADVALASGADGIHLGPDDMHPSDVRKLLGPERLVGVSTGTVAEAIAAAPDASYFGIGAIFGSTTKTDAGNPITPRRITEIKHLYPDIPVVAIGGITAANIREVIDAGAESAAVISAVVAKKEVEQAARVLSAYFH